MLRESLTVFLVRGGMGHVSVPFLNVFRYFFGRRFRFYASELRGNDYFRLPSLSREVSILPVRTIYLRNGNVKCPYSWRLIGSRGPLRLLVRFHGHYVGAGRLAI